MNRVVAARGGEVVHEPGCGGRLSRAPFRLFDRRPRHAFAGGVRREGVARLPWCYAVASGSTADRSRPGGIGPRQAEGQRVSSVERERDEWLVLSEVRVCAEWPTPG